MNAAIREIDSLNREFSAGSYTPDEFVHQIMGVIDRHGARIEVVKKFPNGIEKCQIKDANGEVIGDFCR